jgi:hypothetical protein
MPGKRRFKTLSDIDRHIKNGFGSGELASYKPWLLTRDVPSVGRSHILPSDLCKREHHLLSDHEYRYFLIQLWSGRNSDIRECYPLPLTSTLKIAEALGYRHSVYRYTTTPVVMTTDFLLTRVENGKQKLLARSIKTVEALNHPGTGKRTLEKEEIQRVYWTLHGVHWALVTDRQIDRVLSANLDWAVAATKVEQVTNDQIGLDALLEIAPTARWTDTPLADCLAVLSGRLDRSFEHTVNLFKLALWYRLVTLDLGKAEIHTANPLWEAPQFASPIQDARRRA